MTDSVPGPADDRPDGSTDDEHRQHASADVAPELFDDVSERR
ncbi:hypothetical protein [Halorubrum trapanicum]|nr:hypothetical protein [Halorubrum trapanicum]